MELLSHSCCLQKSCRTSTKGSSSMDQEGASRIITVAKPVSGQPAPRRLRHPFLDTSSLLDRLPRNSGHSAIRSTRLWLILLPQYHGPISQPRHELGRRHGATEEVRRRAQATLPCRSRSMESEGDRSRRSQGGRSGRGHGTEALIRVRINNNMASRCGGFLLFYTLHRVFCSGRWSTGS